MKNAPEMKTPEILVIFPLAKGEIINNLTKTILNFMKYMRIDMILQLLQILNILSCITAILFGLKNSKTNNFNKILFLLPTISLIQIFLSEILEFITPFLIKNSDEIQHIIVATYAVVEFIIIAIFMSKTIKSKISNKIIVITSSLILVTALTEASIIVTNKESLSLEYFNLIEGIFIISFSIHDIINQINKTSFFETFSESEWIAKSGILLSFLIFWPNSVIQKLIIENINIFYYYSFIANSIGYLILFTFLSLSFYASGKSRVN
jgi:hypothetical protein